MPVWHARTADAVADGRLAVIGITQEQHPDRCRLFMQWQEMDWPVMVDALNRLDVKVVPITLLIDEAGIIRAVNPRPEELDAFLDAPPLDPATLEPGATTPIPAVPPNPDAADADADDASLLTADRLVIWGDDADRDRAIELYRAAIERDPENRRAHFRLGVALRQRSESPAAEPTDFADAVASWSAALALDPNQYIWRRRIQQYGPRLDKPYPFYDWVHEARAAIAERGETPHPLRVEPGGAEIAAPLPRRRGGATDDEAEAEPGAATPGPDPDGRIQRDDGLVAVRVIVVPDTAGRPAARVHVIMTPSRQRDAWWNNEVEPVVLHLEPGPGVRPSARTVRHEASGTLDAETRETRTIEFEVQWDADVGTDAGDAAGPAVLEGYLLSYVCEGREGTCVYRRHDIRIDLPRSP